MDKKETKKVDNIYGVKIAFVAIIGGSILAFVLGIFLSIASFAIIYILWEMIAKRKKLTRREKIIGWILFMAGIGLFSFMNYIRGAI